MLYYIAVGIILPGNANFSLHTFFSLVFFFFFYIHASEEIIEGPTHC